MSGISVGFWGMGSYVPEKIMTNYDLEKLVDTSNEWIVERTGIRQRHIAAPEQATSDLAFIAAQRALDDANLKGGRLGPYCSCFRVTGHEVSFCGLHAAGPVGSQPCRGL